MTTAGLVTAALWKERRFRNVVAALSVTICAGLATVSMSMTKRMRDIVGSFDNGRLTTAARVRGTPLTLAGYEKMTHIAALKPRFYASFFSTEVKHNRFGVLAIGPDANALESSRWWNAPAEAIDCLRAHRDGLIVSDKTARRIGWATGDLVSMETPGRVDTPFRVCGVSHGLNPGHVYIRHDYFNEWQPTHGRITFVVSECDTPSRRCSTDFAAELDKATLEIGLVTQTMFEQQNLERTVRAVSAVPELLGKVSLLTVLITMLVAGSTLGMSIEERRGEFSTLRALGFSRARVFWLICCESMTLCAFGGVLGAGLPLLLFSGGGFSLGGVHARDVAIDPIAVVGSIVAALFVGLVVAVWPASRALRQRIIDGLSEG